MTRIFKTTDRGNELYGIRTDPTPFYTIVVDGERLLARRSGRRGSYAYRLNDLPFTIEQVARRYWRINGRTDEGCAALSASGTPAAFSTLGDAALWVARSLADHVASGDEHAPASSRDDTTTGKQQA